MSLKTYAYLCDACQVITEDFREYEDREKPHGCSECGGEAHYTMSAPMVLKASIPDGQRRKNDPTWQALRATSKLKLAHARTQDRDEKNRIKDEIDRVNGKTPPKKRKRPSEILDR